ncbi:MAG TPA: rod shape-determining protein MreD [Macromonas sp.]|nr:rod shape-determining protein MreD [Macromonas sp.]
MIMRPGQPLLLPASGVFIWSSLILTLLLEMLLHIGLGRTAWLPDLLALTLLFWTIHQPLRVSVGSAFVFGLLLDVHQGALLGQHALAYTVLSYLATLIQRRVLWFDLRSQAVQLLPLFMVSHALQLLVGMLAGGNWPGWGLLLTPLLEALLWPLATAVLLAPQRRAHDHDETRPI